MRRTTKLHPATSPQVDEGWDKLDIERSAAQPAIYLFFMVLGQFEDLAAPGSLLNISGSTYTTL